MRRVREEVSKMGLCQSIKCRIRRNWGKTGGWRKLEEAGGENGAIGIMGILTAATKPGIFTPLKRL